MLFYCYSEIGDSTIESRLGDADYSYYFVLKAYLPLLEKLGSVHIAHAVDDDLIAHCRAQQDAGQTCVLLAFAPPHKVTFELPCPVVPVFPWEYSSIPTRESVKDASADWCLSPQALAQAVTHSTYAKAVLQRELGEDFNVESIPAPAWDLYAGLRSSATSRPPVKDASIALGTAIIDSRDFTIASESIAPASKVARPLGGSAANAACGDITIDFGEHNPEVWLVGFYPPEPWGAWSRTNSPWIMLPSVVSGPISLKVSLNGYGGNVGREIEMRIGEECVTVIPQLEMSEFEFELDIQQPSNFITFSGLDAAAHRHIVDPRTIGIGLANITIRSKADAAGRPVSEPEAMEQNLDIKGVVYTSVLNPRDSRKNWEDILTAFCIAFHDREDATLILKMTYKDMSGYMEDIFSLFCQLHPFKCRVIVIHGYISTQEYTDLIAATTYVVNASRSEGQCLPLMEYMSSGIPAIAPDNTAMADYIRADNAFVVASSPEPHYWPHDPQQMFTTLWYRPSWESLYKAFQESYDVAVNDTQKYIGMSRCAWESQYEYCSSDTLLPRLDSLLHRIVNQ
jgi:glycosyltransferase involved in cell wall biosynthesis